MTVLVAVEGPGYCAVGTDAFLGTETSKVKHDGPKWYRRGPVLFLDSGSVRLSQAIKHAKPWRLPKRGEDAEAYLVNVVASGVDAIVNGLKLEDHTKYSDYLLVFRGQLWNLYGDRGVMRCVEGYAAEGAGKHIALGSLATSSIPAMAHDPERRVWLALEAAERHCPYVMGPMHVERIAA